MPIISPNGKKGEDSARIMLKVQIRTKMILALLGILSSLVSILGSWFVHSYQIPNVSQKCLCQDASTNLIKCSQGNNAVANKAPDNVTPL